MEHSLSRRSFLKGSVVVGLGALGAYSLAGCASNEANAADPEKTAANEPATVDAATAVTLHRGYAGAHGDKCFTQVVVAVNADGAIVAANVDDYQYMAADSAGIVPVPNSDADFGTGAVEGMVLVSKADNSDVYSKMMAEKGGATQSWAESMAAIEAFAVGKKPSELKADSVSGATLVDTSNYLAAIAEIAQDSSIVSEGSYEGDGSDLTFGRVNETCHGTKAFGDAVSLVQGDVIVATSIDEFQYMDASGTDTAAVPNSDAAFGENYAEGMVLVSKSQDNEGYSAHMVEKAQATTPWLTSMTAIEGAIAGQEISSVKITGPDDVSGATLVDAAGYATAAVEAAQKA